MPRVSLGSCQLTGVWGGGEAGALAAGPGGPCASATFLVCGAESWPSSGQAHVPGCLWAQGVSRQLIEDSSGGGGGASLPV